MLLKRSKAALLAALFVSAFFCWPVATAWSAAPPNADNLAELRAGIALPAFDHLGNIGHQAKAAAACGVRVVYASGLGGEGYSGLPDAPQRAARRQAAADYVREAKALGIPYRRWVETDVCKASGLAAELSRSNVQYEVLCEDDFRLPRLQPAKTLLVESLSVLNPAEKATVEEFRRAGGVVTAADSGDWLKRIKSDAGVPSVVIRGPATVRAVVRDRPQQTIVHLLNLNIVRRSSFEDEVHPAENVRLTVRVPFESGCSVAPITADSGGTSGDLPAKFHKDMHGGTVEFTMPRLEVAAILVLTAPQN